MITLSILKQVSLGLDIIGGRHVDSAREACFAADSPFTQALVMSLFASSRCSPGSRNMAAADNVESRQLADRLYGRAPHSRRLSGKVTIFFVLDMGREFTLIYDFF